jgi:hypothetical protein
MNYKGSYKYKKYDAEVLELLKTGRPKSVIARQLIKKYNIDDSEDAVRHYVSRLSTTSEHSALEAECETVGIPLSDVNHYWYKGENFSIHVKGKQINYFDIRDDIIEDMKAHSPKYPNIKYPKIKDGHLLVISPADIHIGKLCSSFETGEDYNCQIAVQRVREGVHGIITKAQGFPIDKILLIIGNDILHVDTPRRETTSGTPQDTDGMWYDNFLIAKKIYIEIIETLLQIAPVSIQYNPSNHDYTNGFFLADSIFSWFNKCKEVSFDVSIAHRKYFQYGKNIVGTTHGDGAKETDLALLMAHEASAHWNNCNHRYFYTHHKHHKSSKDYMSVCVEVLRSPSGTDSWHHRNAYQFAPKAIEGFIHHKEHGQIARLVHLF